MSKILAPLSGQVVPLDQVPDDVFAQKVLGDGIAIAPSSGRILSPVAVSYTHLRAHET